MQQPQPIPIYLSSWHYTIRLARLAVIGLIVGVILLFVTEGALRIVIACLTGLAVPIALLLSMIFFRFYSVHSGIVASMINSKNFIGWVYTPDEWEAYLGKETQRKSWRMLILFLVFTLMGAFISGLLYLEEKVWEPRIWMPTGIGFFIGLLIYATAQTLSYGSRKEQANTPAMFVMGLEGFYITGSFYSWHGLGRDLLAIRLLNDSEINIVFQVRSNGQDYEYQFHIPIPESAEGSMPKFVQFLTENPELRFIPDTSKEKS